MTSILALIALAHAPLTMGKTVELPKTGNFDAMAYDPDHRRILASHPGARSLAVLDTATGAVQEIETGAINGIYVAKGLDRYFAAGDGNELVAIDRKTLKVVARIPLGAPGDIITLDTKRQQLYVAHDDGKEDWVFDGKTLKLLGSVAVEEAPEFMEYDKATDRVYENIKSTDHLLVIDPKARKVVGTWNTAPMKSPHGLVLGPTSGRVYSAGRNGKLVVLSTANGGVLKTIDIATGTDGIALDPKLGRIYVPGKGKMTVVSTKDDSVLGEVALPEGAKNCAVDTTTHTVWVNVSDAKGARLVSFKPAG